MKARCHSIEEDIHFSDAIQSHDIIAFCYPICCSRVPRVMREFAKKHKREIIGKKIIIFVSQMIFSGDGARAFTDMFHDGEINIIYAEHFNMPNNVGNVPFLGKTKKTRRYMNKAEIKMTRVCHHIQSDIIVKRGFSRFSKILGNIQGKTWKVKEKSVSADVRISGDCTSCGLCVNICPMKNFEKAANEIKQKGNCTVCYRCVNQCPRKAVTVLIHRKPKWQYDGLKI